MLPTERLPYSPIATRESLPGPDGARLLVWVALCVEEWDPRLPMPRSVITPPAGGAPSPDIPSPDIPNWSWHEYGNRVGFWRLLEVFDLFGIPATLAINGGALERYAPIAEAARERGWEFIGHGYTQRSLQAVEDERADIRRTTEAIAAATGTRPRGWLGPGLTETWETPDILAEEGYGYVCDWVADDQPVWLATRGAPIVSIPYTQECNDVTMMLLQHHAAEEYRRRALDQFAQLHADAADSTRVMTLVVHPYIMGAAHRARYFRETIAAIRAHQDVRFCTGEEILDWFRALRPAPPGGAAPHGGAAP